MSYYSQICILVIYSDYRLRKKNIAHVQSNVRTREIFSESGKQCPNVWEDEDCAQCSLRGANSDVHRKILLVILPSALHCVAMHYRVRT